MNAMVERVAEALFWSRAIRETGGDILGTWDMVVEEHKIAAREDAIAAIEAMRDPTREMLVAGQEDLNENIDAAADTAWRAMIDEALK